MLETLEHTFQISIYLVCMTRDYLSDRILLYDTAAECQIKDVTAEAALGSIFGPVLWNASYDGILWMDMP